MDFIKVSATLLRAFREEDVRYAVIGGFALGFWGVTRATIDIDFLLLLEDAEKAERILRQYHYVRTYQSENVARYQAKDASFGTVDVIYAFREISRNMLARRVEVDLGNELKVLSLLPEDIVGLKVQAIANDSARRDRDLADIRALLTAMKHRGDAVAWPLLEQYFLLFDFQDLFEEIKAEQDETEQT